MKKENIGPWLPTAFTKRRDFHRLYLHLDPKRPYKLFVSLHSSTRKINNEFVVRYQIRFSNEFFGFNQFFKIDTQDYTLEEAKQRVENLIDKICKLQAFL